MSRIARSTRFALTVLLLGVLSSCSLSQSSALERSRSLSAASEQSTGRLLVRTGEVTVSVDDPEEALRSVEALVSAAEGFVERSTADETSVWMNCRVPVDALDAVIDQIATLGKLVRRSVSATDVTDRHADLSARLETSLALRSRMRELLDRATDVKDLLAIEKELARLQADIEAMQTHLERLDSQIQLSSLSVRLEQKRIYGPLGYIGYWTGWALSKLFVIR